MIQTSSLGIPHILIIKTSPANSSEAGKTKLSENKTPGRK